MKSSAKKIFVRFSPRTWRWTHRWSGVLLFLPLLLLSVTGSLLTRPGWFGAGEGWTAYAVSSGRPPHHARADAVSLWISDDDGKTFQEAFPPGGLKDVVDLAFEPMGFTLYVAQKELGLLRAEADGIWEEVPLPFHPAADRQFLQRISVPSVGHLLLRTTGAVWRGERRGTEWAWERLSLFEPSDLYREIHAWHSGWKFGAAGMRIVEFLGWASVLLALTGLVLFFRPGGRKGPP